MRWRTTFSTSGQRRTRCARVPHCRTGRTGVVSSQRARRLVLPVTAECNRYCSSRGRQVGARAHAEGWLRQQTPIACAHGVIGAQLEFAPRRPSFLGVQSSSPRTERTTGVSGGRELVGAGFDPFPGSAGQRGEPAVVAHEAASVEHVRLRCSHSRGRRRGRQRGARAAGWCRCRARASPAARRARAASALRRKGPDLVRARGRRPTSSRRHGPSLLRSAQALCR